MNKEIIRRVIFNKKSIIIGSFVFLLGYSIFSASGGLRVADKGFVSRDYAENLSAISAPGVVSVQSARMVSDDTFGVDYMLAPKMISNEEGVYDETVDRKLIKNGSISMVVQDMGEAREQIVGFVQSQGGFIANDSFSNNSYFDREVGYRREQGVNGSLTIRVPSDVYDATMDSLRGVALVVNNESSNTNDVTEQYADLEMRLKNKRAEEAQYREILGRATKISDVLEVTRYVEQARNEAERLQGQINVMSNQITLATIHVYLESEQQLAVSGVSWNPGHELSQAWRNLLQGSVNFLNQLIGLFVYLPLLIVKIAVYGGVVYFVYRIAKKVYEKIFAN